MVTVRSVLNWKTSSLLPGLGGHCLCHDKNELLWVKVALSQPDPAGTRYVGSGGFAFGFWEQQWAEYLHRAPADVWVLSEAHQGHPSRPLTDQGAARTSYTHGTNNKNNKNKINNNNNKKKALPLLCQPRTDDGLQEQGRNRRGGEPEVTFQAQHLLCLAASRSCSRGSHPRQLRTMSPSVKWVWWYLPTSTACTGSTLQVYRLSGIAFRCRLFPDPRAPARCRSQEARWEPWWHRASHGVRAGSAEKRLVLLRGRLTTGFSIRLCFRDTKLHIPFLHVLGTYRATHY